jgi:hypothetical protein
VRQGQRFLRAELPRILATPPDVLSPRMVRMKTCPATGAGSTSGSRILSNEIGAIARQDAGCERLMSGISQKCQARARDASLDHLVGAGPCNVKDTVMPSVHDLTA